MARVGFIGLGQMGRRMAANLLKHDHKLVVCDADPRALDTFLEHVRKKQRSNMLPAGDNVAVVAASPAEVARTAETALFTVLPSSVEVKEVYFGSHGILSVAGAEGSLVTPLLIDCSTADAPTAQRIANTAFDVKAHRTPASVLQMRAMGLTVDDRGPFVLDAPVSGGVNGAASGTLSFMVGGDEAVIHHAGALLRCMGSVVHHCGAHGTGQASKLCNNLALAVQMAGVSEALALGQRIGLDVMRLSNIFNHSSAQCWSCTSYNPVPGVMPHSAASRGYTAGFKVSHMIKDLEQADMSAHVLGAELPMGSEVLGLYKQIEAEGMGEADFSAIYQQIYGGRPKGTLRHNSSQDPQCIIHEPATKPKHAAE